MTCPLCLNLGHRHRDPESLGWKREGKQWLVPKSKLGPGGFYAFKPGVAETVLAGCECRQPETIGA